MNREFWNGRRVFVTGHTGFKGAWLCLLLERLGATVAGYALAPPTDPSLYDRADAGAKVANTTADLRELGRVQPAEQRDSRHHLQKRFVHAGFLAAIPAPVKTRERDRPGCRH